MCPLIRLPRRIIIRSFRIRWSSTREVTKSSCRRMQSRPSGVLCATLPIKFTARNFRLSSSIGNKQCFRAGELSCAVKTSRHRMLGELGPINWRHIAPIHSRPGIRNAPPIYSFGSVATFSNHFAFAIHHDIYIHITYFTTDAGVIFVRCTLL